jgi:alkanesulfonate monooxygenase SsuD/methylene tetrahydromethanopterin reductase-like flavin-dependent oxidoreductase (luciferase family)
VATVPVILHDEVEQAADFLRPMYALYFGGMGAREQNFHHDVAVRLGYEAEAKRIQDLYLAGQKQEAAAAVPTALVEELALIGPEDKIRDDLEAWRESIATTLLVSGDAETLRRIAGLVLDSR